MKLAIAILALAAVSAVAIPQDPGVPPPPVYGQSSASPPAATSTDVATGTVVAGETGSASVAEPSESAPSGLDVSESSAQSTETPFLPILPSSGIFPDVASSILGTDVSSESESALADPATSTFDSESSPAAEPATLTFDSASAAEEESETGSGQPSSPTLPPFPGVPATASDGATATDSGLSSATSPGAEPGTPTPSAVGTDASVSTTMTAGIPSGTPVVRRRWAWF